MHRSRIVIVFTLFLTLAVPSFASPSESSDPGRDGGSVITRMLKQIKRFILRATEQPAIPIPQSNP